MQEKITKEEFFKSLDFLIKNKKEINKHVIYFEENVHFPTLFFLPTFTLNMFIFFQLNSFVEDQAFKILSTVLGSCFTLFISMVLSFYLNEFTIKKILKNNTKKNRFSLLKILMKKPEKIFKERKNKVKNLHKLFKNNLPNKVTSTFQKMKYSNILYCDKVLFSAGRIKNTISDSLVCKLRDAYASEHSYETAMKHFCEYFVSNYDLHDRNVRKYIEEIKLFYTMKNEILKEKQLLLESSELSKDISFANKFQKNNEEINQNNQQIQILKI